MDNEFLSPCDCPTDLVGVIAHRTTCPESGAVHGPQSNLQDPHPWTWDECLCHAKDIAMGHNALCPERGRQSPLPPSELEDHYWPHSVLLKAEAERDALRAAIRAILASGIGKFVKHVPNIDTELIEGLRNGD